LYANSLGEYNIAVATETQPLPEHWTAWQMFFEAHAAVCARLEAALQARHGLSLRWYDVLLQLHGAAEGRLTMRDLGRAVVISKSGLTGLVDRMAREGLVERSGDPADRRIVHVTLTPEGAAVYRRARADHRAAVADRFLRHVSDGEADVIEGALRRVRDGNVGP
jgi:DNA-binding MarR family transcriptional regulator